MIRHLPFIEYLSHVDAHDSCHVRDGFLALRVFDDWVLSSSYGLPLDLYTFELRDSADPILHEIVELIKSSGTAGVFPKSRVLEVVGAFLRYAERLVINKLNCLASDVYKTIGDAMEWGGFIDGANKDTLKAVRDSESYLLSMCDEFILTNIDARARYYSLEPDSQSPS